MRIMDLNCGFIETVSFCSNTSLVHGGCEVKTKPTQHSVKELRSIGIQPDIFLYRTESLLIQDIKNKIALFCNAGPDAVFTAKDVDCIYVCPLPDKGEYG